MKILIRLFIISVIITSCSSGQGYVIRGKIEGSDNMTFLLQKREDRTNIVIDSAISRRGSFTMSGGSIDYPQMVQLVEPVSGNRLSFYLENSDIRITGDLSSLSEARVTGSDTHDEYQTLIDSGEPLNERYSEAYTEYQAASQAGNESRMEEIENEAMMLQERMYDLQIEFVRNNPASFVAPSVLATLSYEMESEELEDMINLLDPLLDSVPEVMILKERVEVLRVVAIGQKAPDFTMNNEKREPVTLSSLTGSGLLLIDFWAAWCPPCREESPNLVKAYSEFHERGFNILGVSLDQNRDDWLKAIEEDKLTWTQVSDLNYWDNSAARLYFVNSIPSNFLLDDTGTIIAKNLRGEELYEKLNEILGTK